MRIRLDADVTLTVVDRKASPSDGFSRTVLFLHGFPDFHRGWRKQTSYFSSLGYRVIAPDLHGYASSSKPEAVGRYRIDRVARDVVAMLDQLGVATCHLVGHDWGAALAWRLAVAFPERFTTAAMLCVPHPNVFIDHLKKNTNGQALRSSYMAFFQLPVVPELMFRVKGGRWLARVIAKGSRPGAFTEDDERAYVAAWKEPGAHTGMLNWYRANKRMVADKLRNKKVAMPTLVIAGDRDPALNPQMADDSLAYCEQGRVLHVPDATHWVQMEFPDVVNEALRAHFEDIASETPAPSKRVSRGRGRLAGDHPAL